MIPNSKMPTIKWQIEHRLKKTHPTIACSQIDYEEREPPLRPNALSGKKTMNLSSNKRSWVGRFCHAPRSLGGKFKNHTTVSTNAMPSKNSCSRRGSELILLAVTKPVRRFKRNFWIKKYATSAKPWAMISSANAKILRLKRRGMKKIIPSLSSAQRLKPVKHTAAPIPKLPAVIG